MLAHTHTHTHAFFNCQFPGHHGQAKPVAECHTILDFAAAKDDGDDDSDS